LRVLIAGAAGFIGSHLTTELLSNGHEVLAVDNFYTGQRTNLINHFGNPKFELIRQDITFPLFVEVDGIFNLACPASPDKYQYDPVQTIKSSVIGSINLLGLAKRLKVPILQASTSEVYGDPQVTPQSEAYWGNVNPVGSRSCYDEGKRAAETLFSDYRKQHKVETKIARIFNTYGPNMAVNDGRVVSNFIVQALKNEDISIYGKGTQTRSFCYVSDLVDGLIKLFFKEYDGSPVNLGNPQEITVKQLAKEVIELTETNSSIIYKDLPLDDPTSRRPNISKAKKLLDWEPKISRRTGLKKTIDYFKELNLN
jgi:UDP-glucuronate decarboxylase